MDFYEKIRSLPTQPGVYLYKNAEGEVIYVGKAKNLRSRVRSYLLEASQANAKTGSLMREAVDLEYILVANEQEALALENNLIKQRKPRFNILLRDDKTYPYVKLTLADRYPKVFVTRRLRKDGAAYYGPYFPGNLAYRIVELIHRSFLIPSCKVDLARYHPRACLQYYIHRCLGPCVENLTTPQIYASAVRDAQLFLEGRSAELERSLTARMAAAAEAEQFEAAARLRDQLSTVHQLHEKQRIATAEQNDDADVFGYHFEAGSLAVNLFHVRAGKIVDRREFFWDDLPDLLEPAENDNIPGAPGPDSGTGEVSEPSSQFGQKTLGAPSIRQHLGEWVGNDTDRADTSTDNIPGAPGPSPLGTWESSEPGPTMKGTGFSPHITQPESTEPGAPGPSPLGTWESSEPDPPMKVTGFSPYINQPESTGAGAPGPSLLGTWESSEPGPAMKGTGFSPYINRPESTGALAPEGNSDNESPFHAGSVFSALLKQLYIDQHYVPRTILVPVDFDDRETLANLLSERTGHRIEIAVPQRGAKKSLTDLAGQNARQSYVQRFHVLEPSRKAIQESLADVLMLPELPRRIECFDISHIQGAETVASMVVWEDGKMNKQLYRKFKVMTVLGVDDFASMREVVYRRYRRLLDNHAALQMCDLNGAEGAAVSSGAPGLASETGDSSSPRMGAPGPSPLGTREIRASHSSRGQEFGRAEADATAPEAQRFLAPRFSVGKADSQKASSPVGTALGAPGLAFETGEGAHSESGPGSRPSTTAEKPSKEPQSLPSLILIDGGLGQLHAAAEALESLGITSQPLASIAKKEEVIYLYGNEDEPIVLDRRSPVLHLIQLIRDESHRFAVGYHRQRRAMRDRDSELLAIPGVGPQTRQRLITHFGSLKDIKLATAESLAAVVPRKTAETIHRHFHERQTAG